MKLREKYRVQVQALHKEMSKLKFENREESSSGGGFRYTSTRLARLRERDEQFENENRRLREKSLLQEEACDARARDSQEQEQESRTQLEFDDENPYDDNAALLICPFSSSDNDSFDAPLPFEDESLCEKSLVQEETYELDRKYGKSVNRLIEYQSSSLKQMFNCTCCFKAFLVIDEIFGTQMACSQRRSDGNGCRSHTRNFGVVCMPQSTIMW